MSVVAQRRQGLPFLRISLHPVGCKTTSRNVVSDALLDSGSSRHLMDQDFYQTNFPRAETRRTDITLRYVCGTLRSNVTQEVDMNFHIEGMERQTHLQGTFLIIPDLCFNLYLGGDFFQSNSVIAYSSREVYFSKKGLEERKHMRDILET